MTTCTCPRFPTAHHPGWCVDQTSDIAKVQEESDLAFDAMCDLFLLDLGLV